MARLGDTTYISWHQLDPATGRLRQIIRGVDGTGALTDELRPVTDEDSSATFRENFYGIAASTASLVSCWLETTPAQDQWSIGCRRLVPELAPSKQTLPLNGSGIAFESVVSATPKRQPFAMDGRGERIALATVGTTATGGRIWWTTFTEGAAIGPLREVALAAGHTARAVDVFAAADRVVIAWVEHDGTTSRLFAAQYDDAGVQLGSTVRVDDGVQTTPTEISLGEKLGDSLPLVWLTETATGLDSQIFLRQLSLTGGPPTATFTVSDPSISGGGRTLLRPLARDGSVLLPFRLVGKDGDFQQINELHSSLFTPPSSVVQRQGGIIALSTTAIETFGAYEAMAGNVVSTARNKFVFGWMDGDPSGKIRIQEFICE
jgi:hypothetical protein